MGDDGVIISPDTRRADRLPPGQVLTRKWPAGRAAGPVPPFDPAGWDLTVFPAPLVAAVRRFSWAEFSALPRVRVFADLHCADRGSRLDNLWEGVATRTLRDLVAVSPRARFVMVHCEYGFSANLPADDFFAEDSLFALKHDGDPLPPEQGSPVRLVVPRLYAWKSARWVRGVEFMEADRPGYWEQPENGGYHMRGDPWTRNGRHPDGQRFRNAEEEAEEAGGGPA